MRAVHVDRTNGDEELLADLLIRVAERDKMDNVAFPFGERCEARIPSAAGTPTSPTRAEGSGPSRSSRQPTTFSAVILSLSATVVTPLVELLTSVLRRGLLAVALMRVHWAPACTGLHELFVAQRRCQRHQALLTCFACAVAWVVDGCCVDEVQRSIDSTS